MNTDFSKEIQELYLIRRVR